MQPSEIEKKLIKDGNYNIIGTNISGVDNYVGPMVGCSIVLDYYNISRYVDPLLKNVSLNADEVKELVDSFRYHAFHFMEVPTINMVRSLRSIWQSLTRPINWFGICLKSVKFRMLT